MIAQLRVVAHRLPHVGGIVFRRSELGSGLGQTGNEILVGADLPQLAPGLLARPDCFLEPVQIRTQRNNHMRISQLPC